MSDELAMLACNAVLDKLRFPLIMMPKIDGVRGLCTEYHGFVARSMEPFKNHYITRQFTAPQYIGLDGELAAQASTHPDLCRLTTSAVNTVNSAPWLMWNIFDDFTYRGDGYARRLERATARVAEMDGPLRGHFSIVPHEWVNSLEQVEARVARYVADGYEGGILRDPDGAYKYGRATANEGTYLRVKQFVDGDALVVGIEEGVVNTNPPELDARGRTKRSTHKENMVPSGMVGTLLCKDIHTHRDIRVAPGKMPHADRIAFFLNPSLIVNKIIKYQHMPHGKKDAPRFATYQCIRPIEDVVR